MLIKNNQNSGTPLAFRGGGAVSALGDAGQRRGWGLANRIAFGANPVSYPPGYRLHNAIKAPISDGGVAGRVPDARGTATNSAVLGRGLPSAALTAEATVQGYAYGAYRIAASLLTAATAALSGVFARGRLTATVEIGSRPSAFDVASEVMDVQLIEPGLTLRKALRLITAVLAGKISGAAGNTITIRDLPDTKDRVTASVDQYGNRNDVTIDAS